MLPSSVAGRFALLGFGPDDAARLASMRDEMKEPGARFVDGFYAHLRRFDEPALLLASDATVERLERSLHRYFDELTRGVYDEAYVARRARIGHTHHAVQLSPKWYIAAYSRYVTTCLPSVLRSASAEDSAARIRSFLRLVFLDAGIALESYGLLVERDVAGDAAAEEPGPPSIGPAEVATRAAFVGLPETTGAPGRHLAALLSDEAIGAAVDTFLARAAEAPELAPLFGKDGSTGRLRASLVRHWRELLERPLDEAHAADRGRVGRVHERLAIPPSTYLAGMGFQLAELAASLVIHAPEPVAAIDTLCRLAFLDITLVLDAYLIARVDALLRSPRFAHTLVSRMPSGVLVVDREHNVTSANPSVLRLLGMDGALLLGRDVREVLDVAGLEEALVKVQRGGEPEELMCRIGPTTRASRHVRARVVPVPPEGGAPAAQIAIVLDDVTQILALQDRAQASETRWRQLGSDVDGLVWEMDRDTQTMQLVGGRGLPALGFRADEWLGRPGAWTAQMAARHEARWRRAVASLGKDHPSLQLEHRMVAKDGRGVWLATRVRLEHAGSRVVLKGLSVDVTESRRLRVALRDRLRAERILSAIAQRAVVASSSTDVTSYACKELTRARGVRLAAFVDAEGEVVHAWRARGPSTLPESWRALLRSGITGKLWAGDGKGAVTAAMWEAIGANAVTIVPIELFSHPRGVLFVASQRRIDTATARVTRTVGMLLAQTIRQREIESRDAQRRKLEALGTLAAGVAHDFGNMLAAIQSQAELGQLEGAASPGAHEELAAIIETSKRGGNLVKQILSFTRPQLSGPRPQPLGHGLAAAIDRVRTKLPSMEILLDVRTDARARIDPLPLERMTYVLCQNAAEAMGNKGRIEVGLREVTRAERLSGLEDAPLVVELTVRDHGAGIPEILRDRITEPFFTTRATRSGLGLAIAQAIAAAHGAALSFEDAEGGGAVVRFQMPAIRARDARSGRVLVVDDDVLRLDGLRSALIAAGVETTACSSADTALALLPEEGYRLDAIVLRARDERLAARWPAARVLLIGHGASGISATLSLDAAAAEILDAIDG